jgi:CRISPR-associated protein Csd1
MLLAKLCEYSHRLEELAPVGYNQTPIRWLINLDGDGNFLGFITTSSGKKNDRGKVFIAPAVMKSVNVKASLLVGNGEYVLGIPRDPAKKKRVANCHKAFVEQVRDCAESLKSLPLQTIRRFLESLDLKALPLPEDFDPAMNLTFQVEGLLPFDLTEVRGYWAKSQVKDQSTEVSSGLSQCLVCAKSCIPTERFPIKFKVIAGGQSSGMTIVSANANAFESYGLKASRIAPVCRDCAERSAKAYNALLEKEDSRLNIGSLVYLFWTRQETSFNIASLFSQPQPEEVKALIASARTGRSPAALDTDAFYATALSASGARVVVRDWLETTVGQVKEHLARWFALQALVDPYGGEGRPLGLRPLAGSLVRDLAKDLPPNVPRILLKAALAGSPIPSWIMFQAIRRNRAEQQLTRPRAAIIKMVLLSQLKNLPEDTMVQLDEGNQHPSYQCGRLLAVLERVQMLAVSPKATLIDRFYGTASTAPASVFSRLLKGAQAHLGKLRKEKFGAYSALQSRLEEIMGSLSGFPRVLTLEEQGWFNLGYYHQRAWDRAQARARKEEQVAGEEGLIETTTTDENEE